jgi:Peptidase of plants and bacteria
MKLQRDLSLWLVTLVGCSAAASVGCADDLAPVDDATAGTSGAAVTAGTGTGVAGSNVGTAGSGVSTGGTGNGTAGTTTTAGTSSTAGAGAGTGGTTGGTDSGTAGAGGAMGGGGAGGAAGGSGTAGNSAIGPFGITSCQPAFQTACRPNIEFTNPDPNGKGKVFTDAVGDVVTAMKDICCTSCSILYRTEAEIPQGKKPTTVKLVLDTHGGVAQTGGATIQFDLNYINGFAGRPAAEVKQEMLGVLQHESVHIYQNYGTGGTGEGLADLVRARTGYYPKSRWRSEGDWMTAYTASGNFYSWLTGPCSFHSVFFAGHDLDYPYKMNKALAGKSGDTASFNAVSTLIQQTFGKDVDSLWTQYQKEAYGK